MPSLQSNKNDPEFVKYYHALADIIRIFWEMHKIRLERGEVSFDIESKIISLVSRNYSHDVLKYFSEVLNITLKISWRQFIDEMSQKRLLGYEAITRDPYVLGLVMNAERLGSSVSKVILEKGYSIQGIVTAGLYTGTEVTSHLASLFGSEAYSCKSPSVAPVATLLSSKVNLDNIDRMRKSVGILDLLDRINQKPIQYGGIDPQSSTGLKQDILKAFGLGDTLGCPAGMRPSIECISFLKRTLPKFGVKEPKISTTMLEEFATFTCAIYEREILVWYNELSEQEKEELVHIKNRYLIEGKTLREQHLPSFETERGSCPYRKK